MKKTLKKLLYLFVLPLIFIFTGCSSSQKTDDVKIVSGSDRLVVDTSSFKSIYQVDEKIDVSGLVVTFDSVTLTKDQFQLTNDNNNPKNDILTSDAVLKGNYKTQDYYFYVFYELKSENTIFVSDAIKITVNNPSGSTKWLYLIIIGAIIIGISLLFVVKGQSNKKNNDGQQPKKAFYHLGDSKQKEEPNKGVFTEKKEPSAEDIEKEKNNPFITSFDKKSKKEKEQTQQKTDEIKTE